MAGRTLVLDANILIRAVLGQRVRSILERFAEEVEFLVPGPALEEARHHLVTLVAKHGGDPDKALVLLQAISAFTEVLPLEAFAALESEARRRLGDRDPNDWPILACALATGAAIWTEDTDFFGCGVATWTSSRVEIFLGA